jgi:hypothetical protein
MKRRKVWAVLILSALVAGLVLGTCSFLYHFQHSGEGPKHVFSLPGNGALTDDEALKFAKRVMTLDGRYSPTLELITYGNGAVVNRGDDPQYVSLGWSDRVTRQEWFVQLHHSAGTVVGISYPGK